eukprot:TRINITY_DN26297_c0_g1_i1.p1 TRINITY_DN26297_c0_g1~~TRINITY_DN26297_c0_g1_i1.p1  ORF type:complete len:387 (+),score=85.59 TRINITY_DN26297_c0_g1_i1:2-1162(+)
MLFAISDLHADFPLNRDLISGLFNGTIGEPKKRKNDSDSDATDSLDDEIHLHDHRRDSLIIAGDVSDDTSVLMSVLDIATNNFEKVFFCPGNHELWVRRKKEESGITTSLDKFNKIISLCERRGIYTNAGLACGFRVIPMFGYFDGKDHPDSLFVNYLKTDSDINNFPDYEMCVWPEPSAYFTSPSQYFKRLNEERTEPYDDNIPVVTFMHFFSHHHQMDHHIATCDSNWEKMQKILPLQEVERIRKTRLPNFSVIAGSTIYGEQIDRLSPEYHFYGHSHRGVCYSEQGTMFINHPLGYPVERQRGRISLPKLLELPHIHNLNLNLNCPSSSDGTREISQQQHLVDDPTSIIDQETTEPLTPKQKQLSMKEMVLDINLDMKLLGCV